LADLKLEEGAGFKNFVRMTPSDFEILPPTIGSKISGTETKYRAVIPPSIRLAITLRYLATGEFLLTAFFRELLPLLESTNFLGSL
jgi:hypothetical protein